MDIENKEEEEEEDDTSHLFYDEISFPNIELKLLREQNRRERGLVLVNSTATTTAITSTTTKLAISQTNDGRVTLTIPTIGLTLSQNLQIIHVTPDTSSFNIGLKPGDSLTSIQCTYDSTQSGQKRKQFVDDINSGRHVDPTKLLRAFNEVGFCEFLSLGFRHELGTRDECSFCGDSCSFAGKGGVSEEASTSSSSSSSNSISLSPAQPTLYICEVCPRSYCEYCISLLYHETYVKQLLDPKTCSETDFFCPGCKPTGIKRTVRVRINSNSCNTTSETKKAKVIKLELGGG